MNRATCNNRPRKPVRRPIVTTMLAASFCAVALLGGSAAGASAKASGDVAVKAAEPLELTVYKRSLPESITRLKKRGVGMRLGCNRPCFVKATLVTDSASADRLNLDSRRVGLATRKIGTPDFPVSLRVRLFDEVAKALHRGDAFSYTLKLRARDL